MRKIRNFFIKILLGSSLLLGLLWFTLTQPVWVSGHQQVTPAVNANTLRHAVETLSEKLPARNSTAKDLLPTVEWIEQRIQTYGTSQRQSYHVDKEEFHNIILTFDSANDNSRTIVVGAHYDTAGGLAGADDNASGVAGLIELARLLSETKPSVLPTRIELVFYALEEPPYFKTKHMGSYIHAHRLKKAGRNVALMLSLDMIGYFSDQPHSQQYPMPYLDKIYPDVGNFIAIVGNLNNIGTVRAVKIHFRQSTSLPVYSINAPAFFTGIDFSDHYNYWIMGYPAVMITDTAFARNMAYHTAEDTADRLDYEKMAQVVQATYYAILHHDDDDD